MTQATVLVVVPYAVNIFIKIAGVLVERKAMLDSLQILVNLHKPKSERGLTTDQQLVLVRHLSFATLKSRMLVCSLGSLAAAFAVAMRFPSSAIIAVAVWVIVALTIVCYWWLWTRDLDFLAREYYRVPKNVLVTVVFSVFDLVLAIAAVMAVGTNSPQGPHGR